MTLGGLLLTLLTTLAPSSAHAPDQIVVRRTVHADEAAVRAVLAEPERWPDIFSSVSAIDVQRDGSNVMAVGISSPHAEHRHGLILLTLPEGQSISFSDDGHDFQLGALVTVAPDEDHPGASVVTVLVGVTRWGFMQLLPDALVEAQVERFVTTLLDELEVSLATPAARS